MPVGGAKIPVDRNCCLCKVHGKTLLVCLPRTSPQKYLLPYRDQRSSQDTLYRVLLSPNHRTIFPFGLLVFLIQDQKVLPAGMRDACHLQFCYQKAERHAMQIATSDCTDEWKSEQRDQPELFSLLSSETAHQHLHRLQKPDEQANSRKVKERRISNLYLLFGAKALRF